MHENGIESLSASSIAKRANVSKASVFHHFGSMETIQQKAFILSDTLMNEALEQIYNESKETDSFSDIMLKYLLFFMTLHQNMRLTKSHTESIRHYTLVKSSLYSAADCA